MSDTDPVEVDDDAVGDLDSVDVPAGEEGWAGLPEGVASPHPYVEATCSGCGEVHMIGDDPVVQMNWECPNCETINTTDGVSPLDNARRVVEYEHAKAVIAAYEAGEVAPTLVHATEAGRSGDVAGIG